MESNPLSLIKKDFVRTLVGKGQREDGRDLLEFRPLDLQVGYIGRAQGSARVKLGKTQVVAGVKIQLENPYPDTPNRGNFMTSAELSPIASPYFEPGPPRIEGIELARVTDRSLRESGLIDFEALCRLHAERGAAATVVVAQVRSPYGIVELSDDGLITGFREAPMLTDWVNSGVYVLGEEALARLPERGDHEQSTFPELAAEGKLLGYRHEGVWLTVNTPKDLRRAAEFMIAHPEWHPARRGDSVAL